MGLCKAGFLGPWGLQSCGMFAHNDFYIEQAGLLRGGIIKQLEFVSHCSFKNHFMWLVLLPPLDEI